MLLSSVACHPIMHMSFSLGLIWVCVCINIGRRPKDPLEEGKENKTYLDQNPLVGVSLLGGSLMWLFGPKTRHERSQKEHEQKPTQKREKGANDIPTPKLTLRTE